MSTTIPQLYRYQAGKTGNPTLLLFLQNDAAARVLGVSKNIHFKCATFQEALQRYRNAYYSNEVRCVPNLGTRFLTQESASDLEYWRHVDDLSEEMSNVRVA
ncbi:hypothetical protein EDD15DRAFT_2190565 [Pisolithus albus]|nr:hypothetical protein EDD15DRAFT_2190565 [Pisolithus albus]